MHVLPYPTAGIAMRQDRTVLRFDPHLRAADDRLRRDILGFTIGLQRREASLGERTRKRKGADRDKFHLAIEALLSNLIVARAHSPSTLLSVPLSNTTLRGNPRYRPAVYGKHFRDLITLLERLQLIEMVTKGHNIRGWNRHEITTIRPTPKFLKAFRLITATVTNGAFAWAAPPETIILKNSDKKLIDYPETAETKRLRDEMSKINRHLRGAAINIVSREQLIDEHGLIVQATARTLRRIFNNEDWTQGGRIYDGFWETMDRELRLHVIRVDDDPIANVDFRQFNLRLAYALAKAKPHQGDLYDVTGRDAEGPNWLALREGRKTLTNAMINGIKPLTRWPGDTPEERAELASCFPKGTTARIAARDIRSAHPAIAGYFESAEGLGFMRIESDILVATVLSLMKRGITALPLHDAVLVQERHAEAAKVTMQRESKRRIGTAIPAEIKMASD